MEAWKVCLLVLTLMLTIAVKSSSGIKCYVCNSGYQYHGEKCSNERLLKEDEELYRDCGEQEDLDGVPKGTYKLCRVFSQDVRGKKRTIRQCASDGRTDKCIERTGTKEIMLNYCHCDVDGCNTASSLTNTFSLTLALAATLWMLVKRT